MLQPTRTKFRKAHKGRIHGLATSGASLSFGEYGLKAVEPDRVTARQIEAARRAMTRHMKRAGRVGIRGFPDVPGAKKPLEVLKLKKERFTLRFQRATGQLENTARVRQVRRDIARLQTVARQKRTAEH